MEIINTYHKNGYNQWIKDFVSDVLDAANIVGEKAIILAACDMRIYLSVDCQSYTIHVKSSAPTKKDANGITCGEVVEYKLYMGSDFDDHSSMEVVANGTKNIEWSNEAQFFDTGFVCDIDSQIDPDELAFLIKEEELTVTIETAFDCHFDLTIDLRRFSIAEKLDVILYCAIHNYEFISRTPSIAPLFEQLHQVCASVLTNGCFCDDEFDLQFTRWVLLSCFANNLCNLQRVIEEEQALTSLYGEYKAGDEEVRNAIKGHLTNFFLDTRPYGFYA